MTSLQGQLLKLYFQFQHAISPFPKELDLALVVNPHIAAQVMSQYFPGGDPCNPLVSPLFADLHGLPPLLIQVGSAEVLLSDATRFAERARQAGVEVTLEVWPDMPHVWQLAASVLPEARHAVDRIGEYISLAAA
jgi:acetyl esterase/lipase